MQTIDTLCGQISLQGFQESRPTHYTPKITYGKCHNYCTSCTHIKFHTSCSCTYVLSIVAFRIIAGATRICHCSYALELDRGMWTWGVPPTSDSKSNQIKFLSGPM